MRKSSKDIWIFQFTLRSDKVSLQVIALFNTFSFANTPRTSRSHQTSFKHLHPSFISMSVTATRSGTDARVHEGYSFRAANPIDTQLLARITAALGYDPVEAAALPEQANIGEGCGNPLLIAKLSKVISRALSVRMALLTPPGRDRSRLGQWRWI
jgi:hypothetical protein